MLGAIIGDIVGSRFEFDNHKSKEFELFSPECDFTDDSVMTLAVAKALADYDEITDYDEFKNHLVKVMHKVGGRYMGCGYGGRFYMWLKYACIEPYNSYGNGSAMRVSPVAWFASSLEECEKLAQATAEVTHNHPEGIKGAVSVAGAIYLARTGHTMDEIKEYVSKFYTIDFTLDEIRPTYKFNETCQDTVPQAMQAFFESTSFEDAIRNGISIGGDSDTIAAITGSIAEAYYGVQTLRAIENFNEISGITISDHPYYVKALAMVKWAAAHANVSLGTLDEEIGTAIKKACEEIMEGALVDQFPVDLMQGGAGTSTNMNINEVVANRALEIMGHQKGEYQYCHPNDHVNLSQSTNDA